MKLSKDLVRLKLASFAQKGSINRKLVGIITSDLFWILVIGGIFRLFYYSLLITTQHNDSESYINYHSNIFKGNVDALRTPVYPYFIKIVRLFGNQNLLRNIFIAQSFISFFSIVVFNRIVGVIFKTRKVIIAATLVYATMLPIINFDRAIITESLSIFCIILFIGIIARYLKKPTIEMAFTITIYSFFAIMLRPSLIYLLPIIIVFWVLRLMVFKNDKKMCLIGLVSSVFVILLIHGYCNLNKKTNGFYGISTVTNINQLDLIIYSKMYINGNDKELSDAISYNFRKPMIGNERWDSLQSIIHKYKPSRISSFITSCIKHQPNIFVSRIFRDLSALQTTNIFTNYALLKKGWLARKVFGFQFFIFYTTFNKIFILLFFDCIFNIARWVKTKQVPWFSIFLWQVIVAQIAVAIIGAQGEYPRLIVTTIPCLIIVLFSYIDRIYHAIDLNKLKTKYSYI